ncbi:hypothetical protein B0H19DRAFT_1261419 [Mycena capillaripes]|nr:hypothetical protein B0H19DRAFT_1261419 [Mycena capillaripes]
MSVGWIVGTGGSRLTCPQFAHAQHLCEARLMGAQPVSTTIIANPGPSLLAKFIPGQEPIIKAIFLPNSSPMLSWVPVVFISQRRKSPNTRQRKSKFAGLASQQKARTRGEPFRRRRTGLYRALGSLLSQDTIT